MRETGPVKARFIGEGADMYMSIARTELGRLKNQMSFQKLPTGSFVRNLPNGVVIRVQSVFGQDFIDIITPVTTTPAPVVFERSKKDKKFRSILLISDNVSEYIWDGGERIYIPPPAGYGYVIPYAISRDGKTVGGCVPLADGTYAPMYWKRGMSAAVVLAKPIPPWSNKAAYDSEITSVNADGTVMLGFTKSKDNWPDEVWWVRRNGVISYLHQTTQYEKPLEEIANGKTLNFDEVQQLFTRNQRMMMGEDGTAHGWSWPALIEDSHTAEEITAFKNLFFEGKYTTGSLKAREENRITEYNKTVTADKAIPFPTDGSGFNFYQVGTTIYAYQKSPQLFAEEHYVGILVDDGNGGFVNSYKIDYVWYRYEHDWTQLPAMPKHYPTSQKSDKYIRVVPFESMLSGLTYAQLEGAWLKTTSYHGTAYIDPSTGNQYGDNRPFMIGPNLIPVATHNGGYSDSENLIFKFSLKGRRTTWRADGLVTRQPELVPDTHYSFMHTSRDGSTVANFSWLGSTTVTLVHCVNNVTNFYHFAPADGKDNYDVTIEGISSDGKVLLVRHSYGDPTYDRADLYMWTAAGGYKKLTAHKPAFNIFQDAFLSNDGTCAYAEALRYDGNWNYTQALVIWEDFTKPAIDVSIELSKNRNPYIMDMTSRPKKG